MRIVFAGTPEFSAIILQALIDAHHDIVAVYTREDKPAGRGRQLHESPVKQLAKQHHLNIQQPKTLRDVKQQEYLTSLQPDIMIVVAYGLILPAEILTIPKFGCINVHPSLLPRWRGAAPIQRTILSGDKMTGVAIMQMDAGLDTGDVWYQETCEILPDDTAQTLHDRLAILGADILIKTLPDIVAGKLTRQKQDNAQSCYAEKFTKQEALINWQDSAYKNELKVRGFNPAPGAHSFIHEQMVKIWQAKVIDAKTNAACGTIIKVDKEGIDVACGDGVLRLLKIQLAGGKALPISDVLNAHADLFAVGNQFIG